MGLPMSMSCGVQLSYSIPYSARFNGTSAYLQKTLTTSSTTSGSVWVKRSKLGATSPIFDNKVYFTSGDVLYAFGLTSTAVYRDPTAWYHIFWNGTGVYVNGTLVTGTGSYTAASVTNPRLGYDGTNYFSGYMADFAFWDGTSAGLQGGYTDSNGLWGARRPSAGYSFLEFGSSGALGTDTSGNGNNWTVTGLSASDQMVDTPTNNYCTLNPLNKTSSGTASLSNGNLTFTESGGANKNCQSTIGFDPTTGPWYFEFTQGPSGTSILFGVCPQMTPSNLDAGVVAASTGGVLWSSAAVFVNGVNSYTVSSLGANAVVGCLVKNGKVYMGVVSGGTITWENSGNPTAETGYLATGLSGTFFATVGGSSSTTVTLNCGQTAFAVSSVPSSANALCTANLPSVAVTTSGTFTGNANADGPFVWTNGNPTTLTINGNAVTFGTHADKTAGGFKLRSSSASYNTSGSNTWTATAGNRFVYSATSINNAQGNP